MDISFNNNKVVITDDGGLKVVFSEYVEIKANGASGSRKTIDWLNGNIQKVAMTDDCTFTLDNPLAGAHVLFINNGQFVYTATWPENVLWRDNTAPTFTANRVVVCKFYYDGTNYYGRWGEYY